MWHNIWIVVRERNRKQPRITEQNDVMEQESSPITKTLCKNEQQSQEILTSANGRVKPSAVGDEYDDEGSSNVGVLISKIESDNCNTGQSGQDSSVFVRKWEDRSDSDRRRFERTQGKSRLIKRVWSNKPHRMLWKTGTIKGWRRNDARRVQKKPNVNRVSQHDNDRWELMTNIGNLENKST